MGQKLFQSQRKGMEIGAVKAALTVSLAQASHLEDGLLTCPWWIIWVILIAVERPILIRSGTVPRLSIPDCVT